LADNTDRLSDNLSEVRNMAENWELIEKAAARLGVSVRTVERRVRSGALKSRLDAKGRREVLVPACPTGTDILSDRLSDAQEAAQRQLSLAATAAGLAKQSADQARGDLQKARRNALAGWTVAGVLLAILAGAAYIIGARGGDLAVERQRADTLRADLAGARADVSAAEAQAARLVLELDAARADVDTARADKARAEAHLQAVQELHRQATADERPPWWQKLLAFR